MCIFIHRHPFHSYTAGALKLGGRSPWVAIEAQSFFELVLAETSETYKTCLYL